MDHDAFLQETLPAIDMVYAIARRVVPRGEDAEDLVQETYLAAYRAWVDHRRPLKVEPWLATICLNLGRSRYRARSRRPGEIPLSDLGSRPDPAEGPEDRALAAMERSELERALLDLPETQRIAIVLVDLTDLSVLEAAAVMGTPKGTVLSRLHRGRRALALRLASPTLEEERR